MRQFFTTVKGGAAGAPGNVENRWAIPNPIAGTIGAGQYDYYGNANNQGYKFGRDVVIQQFNLWASKALTGTHVLTVKIFKNNTEVLSQTLSITGAVWGCVQLTGQNIAFGPNDVFTVRIMSVATYLNIGYIVEGVTV
jgi:hypothetical protein